MKELLTRSISGLVFLALVFIPIVADMRMGTSFFNLTLFLFSFIGTIEYTRMSGKVSVTAMVISVVMFLPLLIITVQPWLESQVIPAGTFSVDLLWPFFILLAVAIIIFTAVIFREKPASSLLKHPAAWSILYPNLPFALLGFALFFGDSTDKLYLLFILTPIYVNDTFAYATGRLLGKRKMFPSVSPKKTWEGFIGGVAGAQIVMHILVYSLIDYTSGVAVIVTIFGFLASVLATFGDLFESKLKRSAGVKDSGKIIPGHGGILDRIDAMLFVAPVLYVLLTLIS